MSPCFGNANAFLLILWTALIDALDNMKLSELLRNE